MYKYWNKISDPEKRLSVVSSRFEYLKNDMNHAVTQAHIFQNYFDNIDTILDTASKTSGRGKGDFLNQTRFAYNLISPIVQDVFNKMSKVKPKPTFMNSNILYSHKTKLKKLDTLVLRQMKQNKFFKFMSSALLDGYVRDVGIIKTFPFASENKIKPFKIDIFNFVAENPYEGLSDRDEAGEFHKMSSYEIYDKFYTQMSPEQKEQFKEKCCANRDPQEMLDMGTFQDETHEVVEMFIKNGTHIIFIPEKMILQEKKWNYDFIPYDFAWWEFPQNGFIGKGIPYVLTPIQKRINTLLRKISRSLDISMYPYILAHITAKVGKKFTDKEGTVVEWWGEKPPTTMAQHITHPQVFEHFYHMIEMCYRVVRQNQEGVIGKPPGGVKAGIALQNITTMEQSRFYSPAELYENLSVSIAKKIAMYLYKENINDVKEDIGDFKDFFDNIETYPTSIFPYTPEGKLQRAETLINIGAYTPEEVADIYDFPDATNLLTSKGSRVSAIYNKIEQALEKEENIVPDEVLGYFEQNDIALRIYGKLIQENKDKHKKKLVILRNYMKLVGSEIERIEKERIQMALQDNMPTETAPPPSGEVSPSPNDTAVVQGGGQTPEQQQIA